MPDNDYASFIEGYGAKVPPEGNFVSTDGQNPWQAQGHHALYDRSAQGAWDCLWRAHVCDGNPPGYERSRPWQEQ